jgi:hypothetical protein
MDEVEKDAQFAAGAVRDPGRMRAIPLFSSPKRHWAGVWMPLNDVMRMLTMC